METPEETFKGSYQLPQRLRITSKCSNLKQLWIKHLLSLLLPLPLALKSLERRIPNRIMSSYLALVLVCKVVNLFYVLGERDHKRDGGDALF